MPLLIIILLPHNLLFSTLKECSMGLDAFFQSAPAIRPMFNVGCLFDIATGVYISGEHGEMILNGGVPHITGVSGRGETGKSLIIDYFF